MDISTNYTKERSHSNSSTHSNISITSLSTVGSCESLHNIERTHDIKPVKKNTFVDISNNEYRTYNKRVRDYYLYDNSERYSPNIDTFESIINALNKRRNSREYK